MGFAQDSPAIMLDDPRIRKATVENLNLILHQEYWPIGLGGCTGRWRRSLSRSTTGWCTRCRCGC
jgi:hypothetical protein